MYIPLHKSEGKHKIKCLTGIKSPIMLTAIKNITKSKHFNTPTLKKQIRSTV